MSNAENDAILEQRRELLEEDPKNLPLLLEIAEWASLFDCESPCYYKSMETHGGEGICIPCKAHDLLKGEL